MQVLMFRDGISSRAKLWEQRNGLEPPVRKSEWTPHLEISLHEVGQFVPRHLRCDGSERCPVSMQMDVCNGHEVNGFVVTRTLVVTFVRIVIAGI